jgi:L-lysine 2,3-aminomutase
MAHFTHPAELRTDAVRKAIARIRNTGAQIRTQSPILRRINDSAEIWADMWREQVQHGCIPYYMFITRDTGPQDYFALPLEKALRIYQSSCAQLSGLAKTARGPVMSVNQGKIEISGVAELPAGKVFVLKFLQSRNPEWLHQPFFAQFDAQAIWFDSLTPAFGARQFFFEETSVKKAVGS